MIRRLWPAAALLAALALTPPPVAAAVPGCPVLLAPSPPVATVPGPPPQAMVDALFRQAYTAWIQRIEQPDISRLSNPAAWQQVPEFVNLIRPRTLFLPHLRAMLEAGDSRAVLAVECVTGLGSFLLYPRPPPPPGSFGQQDVAKLWLQHGGDLIETQCRAGCAGNAACEQACAADRQRWWGP